MQRLKALYDEQGQSPWIDNLRRDWLQSGQLAKLVASGVRGVTSNPTIFAKAIEGQETYDEQFRSLVPRLAVDDAYWELVISDIVDALEVLRPVYEASHGGDGFVSLEVAPSLAHDTDGTVQLASKLRERVGKPNLLVKVPATLEGVSAIEQLIAKGHSINVTLIFGIDRHEAVMEAYLSGLESLAASGTDDLSGVHSVASFFVSRVDTEIDRRLEALAGDKAGGSAVDPAGGSAGDKAADPAGGKPGAGEEVLALRGRAAVAQAQVAYQHFTRKFSGPRWEALAAKGALVQRPLWASTSTKNAAYADLLYVDNLIGPDTVNTMPDTTIEAFEDHGTPARTVDADPQAAEAILQQITDAGIDFTDVATTLEDEGVHSFAKSFDELIQVLTDKAGTLGSGA